MEAQSSPRSKKGWRSTIWGELSAEFLGTFVLIAFGDGVVAMAVAALNQSGRGELDPHLQHLRHLPGTLLRR